MVTVKWSGSPLCRRYQQMRTAVIQAAAQVKAGTAELVLNPGYPWLCLAGLGVAGYLAYVETTLVRAICGPVGDCNAVQASPYARLFGVLPVGVLGLVG